MYEIAICNLPHGNVSDNGGKCSAETHVDTDGIMFKFSVVRFCLFLCHHTQMFRTISPISNQLQDLKCCVWTTSSPM
jgi:hypothetical protein